MTNDISVSPYASVHGLAPGSVRWTEGFWQDRWTTCRDSLLPALWAIMEGTEYSQYWENFRVAAGLSEGRCRGASFNDGDFYKLLEASCSMLAIHDDPVLAERVEAAIETIGKAQRADGYLHTRVIVRENRGDESARALQDPLEFELYNMGHLLTAACVHYRVTGRDSLLRIACKTADFLDGVFQEPSKELARFSICASHYMGMVELYRVTGEPRYRDLAQRFLDLRDIVPDGGGDDNQDRIPFRQQTEAMGHAVRANYLYAGAADVFAETGDKTLWAPLEPIWANVVSCKMAITGGCGALYDGASPDGAEDQKTITRTHQAYGRDYQQPLTTAHNETCAAIGNVLWNWRMFRVTGEARFIDVIESALYNGILSGVSLEGREFLYVNPLRSLEKMPTELRWGHTRKAYFGSFCCPPNVARTLAQVNEYVYAQSDDAVYVNLYGGSHAYITLPFGGRVSLTQETEYPWEGTVRLRINMGAETPFALRLRIPGWTEQAQILVNGEEAQTPTPGSYAELRRTWQSGDVVEIRFAMTAELIEAHPLVEEARGHVAVRRGPLVYCLESVDLPNDARLIDVLLPADGAFTPRPMPDLPGIVGLEGTALVRTASESGYDMPLYRPVRATPLRPIPLRLVPYFAWGNRGPTEMSVWLPVRWGRVETTA